MIKFDTPVQFVKGVGPKMAQRLKKLEIKTIQELIYYFPRDYIDFSRITPVARARIGEPVVLKVRIKDIKVLRTARKRMMLTVINAEDSSGEIRLVWFNQPYLAKNFKEDEIKIFFGKVEYDFKEKSKALMSPVYEVEAKIMPIYSETAGLNSKYLRKIIKLVLKENLIEEYLPKSVLKEENLVGLKEALGEIHFPGSFDLLAKARKRLAFSEVFLIITKMLMLKNDLKKNSAPQIVINKVVLKEFVNQLPYKLTNAQKKASWEIINDLVQPNPMNRLLEGDVGSGKTVVAVMAALATIKSGFRVVWMAPTEILARQHYDNVCELLKPFNINVGLLTGSQVSVSSKSKSSRLTKSQLRTFAQNSELVIGTHALIQDKVNFENLGLVTVDEQHRFGVKQRQTLTQTSCSKLIPHFLSMTATPIPRTLALSLYGDLDISILDEMPLGRAKTITRLVDPLNRDKAYDFLRAQAKMGHQIFVICPLIEEVTKGYKEVNKDYKKVAKKLQAVNLFELEKKSVKKEFEKLSKEIFPDLKVAMLHGKMPPKEKEKIMTAFRNKKLDIIVSTSVVEVGVDIPNATVMMIENAERFGLAQLHQFRGRVGRSGPQSYCLLFTDSLSGMENRRLKALISCSDGFLLAEKDLEIRGSGELVGASQHGFNNLKIASLTDIILITKAKKQAEKVITSGIRKYLGLYEQIIDSTSIRHLE